MPIWSLDSQLCKVIPPCTAGVLLTLDRQLEPQAGLYLPAHTAHVAQQRPGLRPRAKALKTHTHFLLPLPPPPPQGPQVLASLTSFNSAPSWHMSNPAYNSSGAPCGLQRPSKQSPPAGPWLTSQPTPCPPAPPVLHPC